jgi:hypothetical protein
LGSPALNSDLELTFPEGRKSGFQGLKNPYPMPITAADVSAALKAETEQAGNKSGTRRWAWMVFGLVWLAGVSGGLAWLAAYDNAPGVAAHAPLTWPADSRLTRDTTRPTLVMLAHPRCVCTRASVGELAELMARAHQPPKAYVVFIKPAGTDGNWDDTDLWHSASSIPGVTVLRDDDGLEVRRFGAETSGSTMLYDQNGHLIFSGGTTGSRGHPGDNAGRASIVALLNREGARQATSAVFGCSLFASKVREGRESREGREADGAKPN